MNYLKLFEGFSKFGIARLKELGDSGELVGYYNGQNGFLYQDSEFEVNISDSHVNGILRVLSNIPYEIVEKDHPETLSIHFTKPKEFDENPGYHQYNPSNIYYSIRIYEYKDDWFQIQWFSQVYATDKHMQNYYKKYPHFGPGGSRHTYTNRDGKDALSYQPPIYKGYNPYNGSGGQGEFILCDQYDAVLKVIKDFSNFVMNNKEDWGFFPYDYPYYK